MGSLLSGAQPQMSASMAGADAVQQQQQQVIARIRAASQPIQQLAQDFPEIADDMQQVLQILLNAGVKAAQVASTQTASSIAVPTAGA